MRRRRTLARPVPIDLFAAAANAVELAASLIAKNAIKLSAQTLARESVSKRTSIGFADLWLAPRRPGRWRRRNRPCRVSPAARDTAVVHHRSCTTAAGLVVGEGFLDDSS